MLQKAVRGCVYASAAGIPLAVAPFLNDAVELPKVSLLLLFTSFGSVLWLLTVLRQKKFVWKKTTLDAPVLFYLFTQILAVLFSIHPRTSLYGVYTHYSGFLSFFACVCLFYLTVHFFSGKNARHGLLFFAVLGSAAVSVYALLQGAGFDISYFGSWSFSPKERPFSTLGNPVFLGGYLSPALVLSMGYFFLCGSSGKFTKCFGFFSMLIIYAAMLFTQSRGAYLSFALTLSFLGYFSLKFSLKKPFFFTALSFFIMTAWYLAFSQSSVTLSQRLQNPARDLSVKTRLLTYPSALKLIREKPVLGHGLDTFVYAFQKVKPDAFVKLSPLHEIQGRAHNLFLETASSSGLLGAFALLWLLVSLFLTAWRALRRLEDVTGLTVQDALQKHTGIPRQKQTCLPAVFALACLAHILQAQFNPDVISQNVLFWTTAGLLCGMNVREKTCRVFPAVLIPGCASFFLFAGAGHFLFKCVPADFYFYQGKKAQARKQSEKAMFFFKRASDLLPLDLYLTTLGSSLEEEFQRKGEKTVLEKAIQAYQKARRLYPANGYNCNAEGRGYMLYVKSYGSGAYLKKASEAFLCALKLDPKNSVFLNDAASCMGDLGDYSNAVALAEKARALAPSYPNVYCTLGNLYYLQGKYQKAMREYRKALKRDPHYYEAAVNLASAYYQEGNVHSAVLLYKKAIDINPRKHEAYYNLGILYTTPHRYDPKQAYFYFKKAAKANPASKIIKDVLGRLEKMKIK